MKQHSHLENLLAENDPIPVGRCATCQRSGLPILPLRTAFAPPAGDIEADVTSARLGRLRTLRQGYLYVLLDAQVWQAYAVTEQGLLRQFVPLQMPLDPPAPIAEHCIRENHHLPASFINIDTARYSKAWLAFANDPWPAEVLDRYKHAIAGGRSPLEARFREIDLALAREQPAQLGIAMTAEQVGLEAVLEFATPQLDNFTSAHGFCARWSLPHVFQAYIQTLIERENLPQGVLALTLDDPVGVLQELNAQRLARFEAMLQWRAEPQRRFEHFTSQTLLGLRTAYERSAEAQAEQAIKEERAHREQWNAGYFGDKAALPPVSAAAVTAQHREQALARLEERYDESARAAFDTAYQRDLDRWQKSVDELGSLYTQHSSDPLFALITEHDYSADCSRSLEGFILMVSAVLGGGPTERLPAEDQALGATQALWQRLLEDTGSLFYQSLLAKHGPLLEQVKTGLAGDDLGKVYDWVKSLITSEDGKQLMTAAVQNATAHLLAAANNAQHTLGPRLSRQAQALVGHLHSITLLRYAGQSLTPMTVQLTAGEYLKLLNNTLRTRTEAFIKTLDETLRKPGQAKVRATVMNAAFTAAISTQSEKLITVTLWTLESAGALKARLTQLAERARNGAMPNVRAIGLGLGGLQQDLANSAQALKINASAAQLLARNALWDLQDAVGGYRPGTAPMLLSLGGLWFQQDSLMRNHKALLEVASDERAEALAAVGSATLGVIGIGVEAAGFAVKAVRPQWISIRGKDALVVGEGLVKVGGIVAALAGVMDGIQYRIIANRLALAGDHKAAGVYNIAIFTALGSTGSLIYAAYVGGFLVGWLGIGLFIALITYGLVSYAKSQQSSPMEIWARKCVWGLPATNRVWLTAEQSALSVNELNVAYIGAAAYTYKQSTFISEGASEKTRPLPAVVGGPEFSNRDILSYRIKLPDYSKTTSRYSFEIYDKSFDRGPKALIARSEYQGEFVLTDTSEVAALDQSKHGIKMHQERFEDKLLIIEGGLLLRKRHLLKSVEIVVNFWPDATYHSQPLIITSSSEFHAFPTT